MKTWLSIVAYTCEVAGIRSEGVDFQVRFFEFEKEWQVEDYLRTEPPQEYENCDGQPVKWNLARIYAINEYQTPDHGNEMVGFITCLKDLHEDLA